MPNYNLNLSKHWTLKRFFVCNHLFKKQKKISLLFFFFVNLVFCSKLLTSQNCFSCLIFVYSRVKFSVLVVIEYNTLPVAQSITADWENIKNPNEVMTPLCNWLVIMQFCALWSQEQFWVMTQKHKRSTLRAHFGIRLFACSQLNSQNHVTYLRNSKLTLIISFI